MCRSYIPRHLRLLVNSILNILNILIILTTPRLRRDINKPPLTRSHDPKVLVIPAPRLLSRIPIRRRRRRRRLRLHRSKAPSTTGDIMSPTDIRLCKTTTDNIILHLSHHQHTTSTTLDTILLREKLW